MSGKLILCATPIGNLEDMTYRAVRALKEADLIAAEDTRNSIKLLNHFEIKTPMTSYHEFNKIEKAQTLIAKLKEGANIVLISDAGMPGISDPGQELVDMCHEEGITVTAVPGATASVTAAALSGFKIRNFCFEGFIPTDKKERAEALERIGREERPVIIYEAPHRLKKTLEALEKVLGKRRMAFCRELTKKHEQILRCTCEEATAYFAENEPRGEFAIVIEGKDPEEIKLEAKAKWADMSAAEHVAWYEEQGFDRKEAMKRAAKDRGVAKSDIYKEIMC